MSWTEFNVLFCESLFLTMDINGEKVGLEQDQEFKKKG